MNLILTIYFVLYGLMHCYVYLKAKRAFDFSIKTSISLAIIMILMIFAPVIVRISENAGYEVFAGFAAYAGYTWMAVLSLFFCFSLLIDFYRLSVYLAGGIFKKNFLPILNTPKYHFLLPLIFSVSAVVYGYYEAGQIQTEHLIIKTNKMPKEIQKLKIVQISDLHLGLIVGKKRLVKITDKIKIINPDMLVSTGDIVDGQINHLDELILPLKNIKPVYGKFAVTGNHEFYAGIEISIDFMKKAGFVVLRGESIVAGGIINIAGVDDISSRQKNDGLPETLVLSNIKNSLFTILLKHKPVINPMSLELFDLQLSGHTHKGQIFPFNFVTKLVFPMQNGFFKLSDTSSLYVSRGSGTWGPPIRLFSPPEITVIELVNLSN